MQGKKTVTSELISMLRYPLAFFVVVQHCYIAISIVSTKYRKQCGLGTDVVIQNRVILCHLHFLYDLRLFVFRPSEELGLQCLETENVPTNMVPFYSLYNLEHFVYPFSDRSGNSAMYLPWLFMGHCNLLDKCTRRMVGDVLGRKSLGLGNC